MSEDEDCDCGDAECSECGDCTDEDGDDSMDGDHASALASAGFGTSEDYGDFGNDDF